MSGTLSDHGSLGDCFWHPSVRFDLGLALCDDGVVRGGVMHHGTDYPCTGGAHYAGKHIRCTSPAHPAVAADALPERPERIEEPLPEDLERVLRDPEFAIPQDVEVHRVIRKHLQENAEATVTRHAYLNLWALIDSGALDA